jgi:hypothetical protein
MGYLEDRLSEIDGRLLALLGLERIGTGVQHSSISSSSHQQGLVESTNNLVEPMKNIHVDRAEMYEDSSLVEMSKGLVESAKDTVEHMKNTPVDRVEKHEDSSLVEANVELAVDQQEIMVDVAKGRAISLPTVEQMEEIMVDVATAFFPKKMKFSISSPSSSLQPALVLAKCTRPLSCAFMLVGPRGRRQAHLTTAP